MQPRPIARAAAAIVAAILALPLAAAAQAERPGEGRSVRMARATWDTGWWQAEVYRQLLQELGYEVGRPITLDNPAFYRSVALGDVDLWVNGWFPLHDTYEDSFRSGAVRVGHVARGGALQGYMIDRATAEEHGITYVDDLAGEGIRTLFDADGDGRADLVACPPGWACERTIAHHLEAHGWDDDFKPITTGHTAAMAEAVRRFAEGRPIFFYTWTPSWTVGLLKPGEDVVWLQMKETALPEEQAHLAGRTSVEGLAGCRGPQPCELGWPANDIRPVANAAWLEENPAARALLESASIPIEDIFAQNARMNAGEDSPADLERQAREWIERNRATVGGWLETARDAATAN